MISQRLSRLLANLPAKRACGRGQINLKSVIHKTQCCKSVLERISLNLAVHVARTKPWKERIALIQTSYVGFFQPRFSIRTMASQSEAFND